MKLQNIKTKRIPKRIANRTVVLGRKQVISVMDKDFNTIESGDQAINIIGSIAAYAGRSAASEAKTLHMSKVYANAAKVIVETADGEKTVVATASDIPGKKYYRKYTLGTIIHAIER